MIHWLNDTPPEVPFMASIFNYFLSENLEGYEEYDIQTLELVKNIPGYLGYESMKHEGRGCFISYWKDEEAIKAWAKHPVHVVAKKHGAAKWYRYYHSAIAEVTSFHQHSLH